MNGGVEAASKGLKGQFRSHFAELRLHQRWDGSVRIRMGRVLGRVWGGVDLDMGRVWGGVAVSGRRQLESVLPVLFPPVFCSHSAKLGHESPPAAHTSVGTQVGHTPFMDPRPRGAGAATWTQTLRPRIQQRRQRMRQQAFSFPANFPPQMCCSVHVLASLGTLQQNEWLPRLEKLLNIPSQTLLSVSNSDPEFFSLVRSRDQTRENVETIRRHKKRVNSEAYF